MKVYIVWTWLTLHYTTLYYSICQRNCVMRVTCYDDLLLWLILDWLKMAGYCSVCGFTNASIQPLGTSQYVALHAAKKIWIQNRMIVKGSSQGFTISIAFGGFSLAGLCDHPCRGWPCSGPFWLGQGRMKFMWPGVGCSVCLGNDRW